MATQSSNINRSKVNRTVIYWTTARKPRPAIITAAAGTIVSLRIGHSGQTYTNVAMRTNRTETNVWSMW